MGNSWENSYPTTGWFSLPLPLISPVVVTGYKWRGALEESNSLLIAGNMRKLSLLRLLLVPYPTCSFWPAVDYEDPRRGRWAGFTFNQSKEQVARELPNSKCPDYKTPRNEGILSPHTFPLENEAEYRKALWS